MGQKPGFWSFNVQNSRNLSPSEQEVFFVGVADLMRGCGGFHAGHGAMESSASGWGIKQAQMSEGMKVNQEGTLTSILDQDWNKRVAPFLVREQSTSSGRHGHPWGSALVSVDHCGLFLTVVLSICGRQAVPTQSSCTEELLPGWGLGHCVPSRCLNTQETSVKDFNISRYFPAWGSLGSRWIYLRVRCV